MTGLGVQRLARSAALADGQVEELLRRNAELAAAVKACLAVSQRRYRTQRKLGCSVCYGADKRRDPPLIYIQSAL